MHTKTSRITFHYLSPCRLSDRNRLKAYLLSFFKKEKIRVDSLKIVFCGDAYLLEMNRRFLRHDYYTDILSFPYSKKGSPLTAEIYISVDRVRDNAKNENVSFREELHRVIFHGALHFSGYRDKTRRDIFIMRQMEEKCLRAYFKRST